MTCRKVNDICALERKDVWIMVHGKAEIVDLDVLP